jgi:ubiquinone/menaquinone biosynthesis C-methylase UbiE
MAHESEAHDLSLDFIDTASSLDFMKGVHRDLMSALNLQPRDRVLDVGCGPGDRVVELARQVGPGGSADGVDFSSALIEEARKRWASSGLPVSFQVGDAHALPFPDATFDACRAERVFVHLQDPPLAFAEMVRVSKPGARIAVFDMDADTLIVDAPSRATTRKILDLRADLFRSKGWIGRGLRPLYMRHGLADVNIAPATCIFLDYEFADQFWSLGRTAALARSQGLISSADEDEWMESLREAGAAGRFFLSITAFLACGTKPGRPTASTK